MRTLITALVIFVSAQCLLASDVKFGAKGWEIRTSELGKLVISYPKIGPANALIAPGVATLEGNKARMSYSNGSSLEIQQTADGVYLCHFTSVPESAKTLKIESNLPFAALKGKASWSIDSKPEQKFAAQYAGQPFLYKGDAKRFAIKDAKGDGFTFIMEWGYQQLQDNREWKTDAFVWFAQAGMPSAGGGQAYMTVKIANTFNGDPSGAAGAAAAARPAVQKPAAPATNAKPTFTLSDKGAVIHAGVAGNFSMSLPALSGLKTGGKAADVQLSPDGKTLIFKFPAGGTGKMVLASEDTLAISLADLPQGAKGLRTDTAIPINFNSGGKYVFGGAEAKPFPKDKPASPYLFQGQSDPISIVHMTGGGFAVSGFEPGTFHQLQDNREWNWGIFFWWFEMPLPAGNDTPSFTLKLSPPVGGSAQIKSLIDRFGQHQEKDFPEKVKSDDDLKKDVEADNAYYASLNPPQRDRFGGLPDSGAKYNLKKTGYFHPEKIKTSRGETQVLVDPDGNLFFQLGICAFATPCDDFTTVRGREAIYEWLPKNNDPVFRTAYRENDPGVFSFYLANRIRKFGQEFSHPDFFAETVSRLRKWGYNSVGAFSALGGPVQKIVDQQNVPYVTFLPLGKAGNTQILTRVWDPFEANVEKNLDEAFKSLDARATDPQLIGYFLVNEPLLEDVPKVVPTLKASKSPAKAYLVKMLQDKYGDIAAYNSAWDAKAAGFDELKEKPLVISTKQASHDMQDFYQAFLERRYSLVNKFFRQHDPNHLLIGDRWMPGTANSEMLVKTAGKYYDVITCNYYTYAIDKSFLDRLHNWSGGKPMILSEFYFACRDQGLMGGTQVMDQHERGLAYRNYVEQAIATGYVVGIQWFSHLDQAATGRFFEGFNGEAANIGLVNVADRPYKTFLAEAMKTNYRVYDVIQGSEQPFAFDDPRFTTKQGGTRVVSVTRMTKPVVLDGRRDEWPAVPPTRIGADRLVHGENAKDLEATFRAAWDDTNFYVYVEITDTTPMVNSNRDDAIWAADCIELFFGAENLDQGGNLQFGDRQVLIRGAASDATHSSSHFINTPKPGYAARTAVVPGIDGKSYTIEAAIPLDGLGFVPQPGKTILFDLSVNDGGGGRRTLAWNGTHQNSKDRGVWGRAQFTN